jgi:outer membrane protein TolC
MQKEIVLMLCLSMGVSAQAQQTPPTLNELLEKALQKSHKLEIANQHVEASNLDRMKLKEAYLPTAEISGKYGFMAQNIDIKTQASTVYLTDGAHQLQALDNGITSRANLVQTGLDVSTLIYSGGKVPALKKALNEKINAQKTIIEKDRQQIIEDVLKSYDQLALLDQVKLLLDESQKRLDVHKKTADKALEYGLITKYEQQKLDVAQSQLNSKKQSYEGQRNLLIHQMAMYTGIETERLQLIKSDLKPVAALPGQNSVDQRPELRALDHVIKANQHQITAAQTWWKPKVMASTSLGYMNLFDAKLTGKTELPHNLGRNSVYTNHIALQPDFRVGIGFKWEIFDGWKGKREIQKARVEVKIAELEKEEAKELLELNLIKSHTDLSNAINEIAAKKTQMSVAEDALGQATKEFKTGLLKSSDLIDAENDFLSASLDYQQAVFNQRRTAFALLKATGNLNTQNIKL